jgi:hypothetical protein
MTLRGKKKNGPKDGRTYLENARDAWKPLPDWVQALAHPRAQQGP